MSNPNQAPFDGQVFDGLTVADQPLDLLAALCAFWGAQADLVSFAPTLYFDEAPDELAPPYAVLSLLTSVPRDRNTGRGFGEDKLIQFAVYASTQDVAVDLGIQMRNVLDTIQDAPLLLIEGKQRAWFWAGERLMKQPGKGRGGADVWQQAHTYKLTIGKVRAAGDVVR